MILSPVVINQGLLSAVNNDPCRIANLNLGTPVTINVTGDFSVVTTVNRVIAPVKTDVNNILGADPGMVILLFGNNVRLNKGGGNLALAKDITIDPGITVLLYYTGTEWLQLFS